MIKIKISYDNNEQKQKLLETIRHNFIILKESKEQKKEGKYKKVYLDLK